MSTIEQVAATKQYQVGINRDKNRIYLKIIGFWRSVEEVSTYVPDLERALIQLTPGFTLLTDLTQMKAHPLAVQPVHLEAQRTLMTRGLTQTAEVCASSIVEFQAGTISKKSSMPLQQFATVEEAEAYLDTMQPAYQL